MTQPLVRELQLLADTDVLVELDRSPLTNYRHLGFVVGVSNRFLVLNAIDDSYFLTGFTVVRLEDIRRVRVVKDRGEMIRYVLSQRYPDGYPQKPLINVDALDNFSFLESIHDSYPLLTLFRDNIGNTVCSIGRIGALKPKTFTLQTIDIDAEWDDVRRFRYEDVTQFDVGGNYETGLWMYAENLRKRSGGGETGVKSLQDEPSGHPMTFLEKLHSLISTDQLIEVDRSPMVEETLWGFVVGVSDQFLTMNVVDDAFFLDGFAILRIDEIERFRVIDDRGAMARYILSQRYPKGFLRRPNVDLGEMNDFSFLEKIQAAYPLVSIFREESKENVFLLGEVEALKPNTFDMKLLNPQAEWEEVRRVRYDDVTQVSFGGKYADALRMYAVYLGKNGKRVVGHSK